MDEVNNSSANEGVPQIYPALAKVMAGISNVPKTGEMKFGGTNYMYLRADDVQTALNPLLNQNSVLVLPQYEVETLTRGRGEGAAYVYVHMQLTYISAIDGSTFGPIKVVSEAAATDEKSINKAVTAALKLAHRATFQFASGEPDPDDYPSKSADAPTGPNHREQKIATAKAGGPAPATGGPTPDAVTALQAKVKEAGAARKASDQSFPGHMAFGKALLGKDAEGWTKDPAKLQRVLEAIEGGEAA